MRSPSQIVATRHRAENPKSIQVLIAMRQSNPYVQLQFVSYTPSYSSSTNCVPSQTLNPNPAMQLRYWSMVLLHSMLGSAPVEKSMHSSRFDFSSLHTQQGYVIERSADYPVRAYVGRA
jgi:hypothetical protein